MITTLRLTHLRGAQRYATMSAMLQKFLVGFTAAKSQYEQRRAHDRALICRAGSHMNCAVIKLQKSAWTNDDLTKMGNQTGIFFSIWISEAGAEKARANYNIHAMSVRHLTRYRLTGKVFCSQFRKVFDKVGAARAAWPNVSTDFGCCTLMQGWYDIAE